jgi:dihydrofolate reductase
MHCIKRLKAEKGGDMQIVGGMKFASGMINKGLVDEYRIVMNPVILGKGESLYGNMLERHSLECFKAERMDNGVVILSYRQIH